MAHTYHELKAKTLHELRDVAKGIHHEAVQGASQMNKEHLLPAICRALGIDTHEHAEVVGVDKPAIKAAMRAIKKEIATAVASGDEAAVHALRRQRHALNHQIRAHVAHTS